MAVLTDVHDALDPGNLKMQTPPHKGDFTTVFSIKDGKYKDCHQPAGHRQHLLPLISTAFPGSSLTSSSSPLLVPDLFLPQSANTSVCSYFPWLSENSVSPVTYCGFSTRHERKRLLSALGGTGRGGGGWEIGARSHLDSGPGTFPGTWDARCPRGGNEPGKNRRGLLAWTPS